VYRNRGRRGGMLGVGTGEGERWASKLIVKSEKCFETC